MFDRVELKENAKCILRGSYWYCLLACVIAGVIQLIDGCYTIINSSFFTVKYEEPLWMTVVSYLIVIFVINVLTVGLRLYFINLYKGKQQTSDIFLFFNQQYYFKTVGTVFLRDLYTVLWSLLLIVPGVIKGLSYSMVEYIIAENPEMSTSRALKLSEEMTNGCKGDILVMHLSFLGWFILGMLAAGLGIVFVEPYFNASFAGLYYRLKVIAFERGIIEPNELPVY